MNHVCLALPVVPGKSEQARTFMRQLDAGRRAEYDQSERRIGMTKELWYLAHLPSGDQLIGYMESPDFGRALQLFVASRDAFDEWFKAEMLAVTGFDLNNPPANMQPPELLTHYQTESIGV